MTLRLDVIDVECILGERPNERTVPRPVRIDLSLEVKDDAAESDELSDAADYAEIVEKVRAALVAARCRLVEKAAKVAAEACLAASDKVLSVVAAVTKSAPVPHLRGATAVYTLSRDMR